MTDNFDNLENFAKWKAVVNQASLIREFAEPLSKDNKDEILFDTTAFLNNGEVVPASNLKDFHPSSIQELIELGIITKD